MKIPPLKNECKDIGKRETYGLSRMFIEIDEVSEMLENTKMTGQEYISNSMVKL